MHIQTKCLYDSRTVVLKYRKIALERSQQNLIFPTVTMCVNLCRSFRKRILEHTFNVSSWFKTLETVAAEKPVRSAISFIVAILNPSLHDTFQYFSNRISYVSAFHGLSYHIAPNHATNCYGAVTVKVLNNYTTLSLCGCLLRG